MASSIGGSRPDFPGVWVDVPSRREVVQSSVVGCRMHVTLHMRAVALGIAAGAFVAGPFRQVGARTVAAAVMRAAVSTSRKAGARHAESKRNGHGH